MYESVRIIDDACNLKGSVSCGCFAGNFGEHYRDSAHPVLHGHAHVQRASSDVGRDFWLWKNCPHEQQTGKPQFR